MNSLQFFALLTPALGSFVLVILAWINSNTRATRLEAGQDQLRYDLDKTRSDLRGEIAVLRTELRTEIAKSHSDLHGDILQLRTDVSSLRDMVYRAMVSLHERVAAVEAKNP